MDLDFDSFIDTSIYRHILSILGLEKCIKLVNCPHNRKRRYIMPCVDISSPHTSVPLVSQFDL